MSENNNSVDHINTERIRLQNLFDSQSTLIQRYIDSQAKVIVEGITKNHTPREISLPDKVTIQLKNVGAPVEIIIPQNKRKVATSHFFTIFTNPDPTKQVMAIFASGSLLRHATATFLVHQVLPAGKAVQYAPLPDEIIPTVPVGDANPESAITQASDAITEEGDTSASRGELQTPFVPAQRLFFLPQWVSFEPNGNLLTPVSEAEANLRSMQNYVSILHRASSIAPYIVADEVYQRKRYGILGQLINQGRALATYRSHEIIAQVKARAQAGTLNRGLSLSLPYFDDQDLKLYTHDFEVIPAGRIQFVPAFVVRACRAELAKVEQDTRLNRSTRSHLIMNLLILHDAFLQ